MEQDPASKLGVTARRATKAESQSCALGSIDEGFSISGPAKRPVRSVILLDGTPSLAHKTSVSGTVISRQLKVWHQGGFWVIREHPPGDHNQIA